MVIDHMLLLFSHEQIAMQEAGTRVLMVVEPPEILQRLFPTPELRNRVEAGERRLSGAKCLRFTNAAGTDVTYNLGGKSILTEYGYTCSPGRWDHWPGGFLATVAADKGVNGRVVMDFGRYHFSTQALRHGADAGDKHGADLVEGKVRMIPEAKTAMDNMFEAGFIAACLGEEYGGLQLPVTVASACMVIFQSANMGLNGVLRPINMPSRSWVVMVIHRIIRWNGYTVTTV